MNKGFKDDFDCSVFSERFREKVGELGLSQALASKKLGITEAVMSFYLAGKRAPSARTLFRLCRRLDVSADWLLGLDVIKEKTDEHQD